MTEQDIKDIATEIKQATAQVIDTHDSIDLWLLRARSLEEKGNRLLFIVNSLDEDIRQIREMQAEVRTRLKGEEKP